MLRNVLYIDSIEKLGVIADPFRIQILNHLREKAYSPNKLSKILNKSAQNVNYHFKQLYDAGIIYKKYEEKKRGAFESYFQVLGSIIRIDKTLLNENQELSKIFNGIDEFEIQLVNDLNNFKKIKTNYFQFEDKNLLIKKVNELPNKQKYILITVEE
jgi:DNA-binding transcriptional ArsR family regulator